MKNLSSGFLKQISNRSPGSKYDKKVEDITDSRTNNAMNKSKLTNTNKTEH